MPKPASAAACCPNRMVIVGTGYGRGRLVGLCRLVQSARERQRPGWKPRGVACVLVKPGDWCHLRGQMGVDEGCASVAVSRGRVDCYHDEGWSDQHRPHLRWPVESGSR